VVVPQPEIERVFAERAAELGVGVQRGTEVVSFSQDAEGVRLLVKTGEEVREWAYAGLSFDLTLTILSILLSGIRVLAIIQPLIVLIAVLRSYFCWRMRRAKIASS